MTEKNYDVIIIGAGSVGTPLALELAERGRKVLVLDELASAGQGQNKEAIGGVRATHSDGAKIKTCLRSLEVFSTWHGKRGDDIGWLKGGYCFPVYTESDERLLKEMLKVQQGFGLNISWLDPEEIKKLAPGIATRDLRGGTYSPDDGSASPLLSGQAFYRAAVKAGAEFRFHERVTGITAAGGAVKGVMTDKGSYGAAHVVDAAGAKAAEIAELAGVKVPVRPDCHEAGITEPLKPFLKPMIVDIRPGDKSKNYYFYQNSEGQLVFCLTPNPPVWGDDCRSTSEFLPEVSRRMINLMPQLSGVKVRRIWRGLYPMTPDGFPIVDAGAGPAGFVLAVGMCGQGFMLGPGLAPTIARSIEKAGTADDKEILRGFRLDREFAGMEQLK